MRLNTLRRAYSGDLITYSLSAAFNQLGHDSQIMGLNNVGTRSMAILSQSGGPLRRLSLKRVKEKALEFRPDFVFTCFEDVDILGLGPKVVYWRLELKHSDGRGGDRFREGFAGRCDLLFDNCDGREGRFLPSAVSPSFFHPEPTPKTMEVSCTCSWYPDRERAFETLLYPWGNLAHVYGADWERSRGMNIHPTVSWDKLSRIYSSSKVNIDVHHKMMAEQGGVNPRFFEILACGGLLVSDYTKGVENLAQPGKDFICVRLGEDVKQIVQGYSEEERAKIAQSGHALFLSNHTTLNRATRIMEAAKSL